MPKREEVLFGFDKSKHFNPIVNLLPSRLRIYSKFVFPAIFELDKHFVNTLISGVLIEFINFTERVKNGITRMTKNANFIISDYEFDLVVFALR